jgi:hypothetical protein
VSASAGSIRAGKAHVELGVDGKPLDKGLNDAQAKLTKFQQMAVKGAKGGTEGGLIGGLIAGGPMGAAVASIGVVGKALFEEFVQNPRQIADAMQKMSELSARSLEQFTARMEASRQAMARLDAVAGTPAGLRARRDELAKVRAETQGLETAVHAARKEHEKLASATGSAENASLWLSGPVTGGLEGQRVVTAKTLEEAQQKYNAALKRRLELEKELQQFGDPQKNQTAKDSIESFTKSLRDQVKQLEFKNTLTKEDIELQKLMEKHGWKEGHFRTQDAKAAIEELRVAEANDALDEFTKQINKETRRIEQSGLSDEEFELNEMLNKNKTGADDPRRSLALEALRNKRMAEAVEAAQHWTDGFDNHSQSGPLASRGAFQFASGSQFYGTGGSSGVMDRIAKNGEETNKKLEGLTQELRNNPPLRIE